MASAQYARETKKILTNNFNNGRLLIDKQIKTLKKYKEFYEHKKSSKGGIIKPASVWNALTTLRQLGLYLKKPYEEATKQDMLNFFTKHLNGKSEATISNWKVIVRSFYKWQHGMKKKHEFPEVVDDERLEPTRAKPRKVSPGDLLTKDEVLLMIENCFSSMDKAIVSIWAEMGLRAKEYISANIDSVEFLSGGAKFYVEESKTEEGFVPLIQSAPYLEEWISAHPYRDNPKAPLFVSLKRRKKGESRHRLDPNGINQKLKRIAKRAGIKKRIFTHLGRNMSITRMEATMSVEDNARLHGITPNTVFKVYTRRTRKEATERYFDVHGRKKTDEELVKEKTEKQKLLPKYCENCGEMNPFDRHYCKKCLRPIDLETFSKLGEERERQMKEMKESLKKELLKEIMKKEMIGELLNEV